MSSKEFPPAENRDGESVILQSFFRVVSHFKWKILTLSFIVTLLTIVIVYSITPRYIATATLLIEAEQTNVVSIEDVYNLNSGNKEYFVTQLEILKSRHISSKVVNKLDLISHPEFDPDQQPEQFNLIETIKSFLPFLPQQIDNSTKEELYIKKQEVVSKFISRLSINLIKNTQLITISFESESPLLAALVANTVAEIYIENHFEAKLMMTAKASTWFNKRLSGLKGKLDKSATQLLNYQKKEKLIDINGVEEKNLKKLKSNLSIARQKLEQNEHIYNMVQSNRDDINSLIASPEVSNHQLIKSINKAVQNVKTKVSELQGEYGPKHPIMIAAKSELRSVNDNLSSQLRLLVSGVSKDYQSAKAKVAKLMKAVKEKGQKFQKISTLNAKQNELKREVKTNQYLYNAFFDKLKETKEVTEFQPANARLTDPALPPLLPAKPKKNLIVGITFVLCLGLGLVLALLLEFLNDGIRSINDIENKLKQRMLGLLPLQKTSYKSGLPLRHFFEPKEHAFGESIRTLRTSLLLMNIEHEAKVISVTSSVPGEGKTTVSINLSFALGQLEKVLLIDADMRRPSIAKSFGFPSGQTGLSNILADTHTFDECLIHDEQSNIDVICAGTLPPNPLELLASKAFSQLIETVKGKYDRIVIDTPPTQAVSDTILLSQQSDSLLYVVKADNTREKVIKSGLRRLIAGGIRIDGIVLNYVDLKQAAKYGEYIGFYDQYGYNAEVPENSKKEQPAEIVKS